MLDRKQAKCEHSYRVSGSVSPTRLRRSGSGEGGKMPCEGGARRGWSRFRDPRRCPRWRLHPPAPDSDAAPSDSDAAPVDSDPAPVDSDLAPINLDPAPVGLNPQPIDSGAAPTERPQHPSCGSSIGRGPHAKGTDVR